MKTSILKTSEMDRFVEHQMRNWELAKAQRLGSKPEMRRQVADFICISREVGVGAGAIANEVAQRLGWPVFDKEILHAMSGDDAFSEQVYASMDERDVSWCEQVLRSFLDPQRYKGDFFPKLCKTILALARQGSAVFVGRGADLILPAELGLRVRIISPLEVRIKNMAERLGVSQPQPRAELAKLESLRNEFIRRHFHKNVDDPSRYDLVINLRHLTQADAAGLIFASWDALNPSGAA